MEAKKKSSGGWLHGFIFGLLLSIAFNFSGITFIQNYK